MFSQYLFVLFTLISVGLSQSISPSITSTHPHPLLTITGIATATATTPTTTPGVAPLLPSSSAPRSPLIYSTSTAFSTSNGYQRFETVVNGHSVDLISSYGGNTVVTIIEDRHGSKTTVAGQVYTVATGDISTIVASPVSTKQPNSASTTLNRGRFPFSILFAASAVITFIII